MSEQPETLTKDQEDHLQRELNRSGHAERIMKDDYFLEAVEAIQQASRLDFDESLQGEAGDEQRRYAHFKLAAINEVVFLLETHIETGRLAQKTLGWWSEQKRKIAERLVA